MLTASSSSREVKHEVETNNISILKELKLFFTSNKYQGPESQDCSRYNSVLERYNAILVYAEDERIHKLWVNDEPLEPQDAIETLAGIIESLEALHARNRGGVFNAASSSIASSGNIEVKIHTERDTGSVTAVPGSPVCIGGGDTIVNNPVYINYTSTVDELTLSDTKEKMESSIATSSEKARAVTGYYESNDILFLRDALLNKEGLKLDADNSIFKEGYRTYLVPPFCGADGLAVLDGLKETICIALLDSEKTKQILCPYRMKECQHWVTICILIVGNIVHFKLYDSAKIYNSEEIEATLQDFFQEQKAFSDFIAQSNRTPKLTKIDTQKRLKTIFLPLELNLWVNLRLNY